MKLRQLFENIYEQNGDEFDGSLKVIGVCFGRFNPPHRGHKAVWQAASANPIWYVGTNESTSGPKDPLPYDVKLQAMAAVWPKVAGHVIPEQSLLTLAAKIYSEHGANVHLKVYTDEDWLVKTLTQYNGVEKEHGMYKFQQIDHVRTERLASATNLRAAVRNGDRAAFYKDMGIKPSVTINVGDKEYPVFDVVAHYLNKYPEKTKKAAVAESYDHNAPFNAADFNRHMEKLRAREELKKTDPMRALVAGMIDDEREKERLAKRKKPDDDSMSINDPRHPGWNYTEIGRQHHNVDEGEVVKFPKKHKGDITDMHSCPKCGGDLQGGKYMGHQVQVCMPCKQVYLPPNSGIDQQGNKIKDEGVAEGLNDTQKKIEDTINKLEDRLKHAKSDEQWDRISARIERLQAGLKRSKQGVAEGLGTVSVRQWANQVRRDHGTDVKFRNRQEGSGAVDSVIAKNSQGKTVGVYNRKTGYPTVYEPEQSIDEIAGAFPSPSTREKWAKDAAASNAAEAKRLAAKQAQADAQRLATNTPVVDRLNKVNYSGANAPKPSNATWDGDSDFLDVDGTKYNRASRMPIPGGEAPDMKLIVTQEGWQVYVWTRNSLKGVVGRYFFPAAKPNTIQEASGYIPKNKKEAKDPRWSTALTKDVTIGAIGKNLRAFKLAEQIAEMERELIESSQKKITKRVQQATAGLNTYGDSEHVSGDYTGYRLGLAVAGADGKTPIDMKAKSWIGKKKSTHPYTKEEQAMLKQAYKAVGADYKDMNNGDMKSKELDSTNKTSPVAAPKKNKYGV